MVESKLITIGFGEQVTNFLSKKETRLFWHFFVKDFGTFNAFFIDITGRCDRFMNNFAFLSLIFSKKHGKLKTRLQEANYLIKF